MAVVNLFELSRNFNTKGQTWLMERYIQQQEPVPNVNGMLPGTPAPTATVPMSGENSPLDKRFNDTTQSLQGTSNRDREIEMEM